MSLHIFVDVNKEVVVHTFRGDEKEAQRFLKHRQEHNVTHIRIQNGNVTVGD
jgi:Tat protein secretion system quality control protein TatD with DNase activity